MTTRTKKSGRTESTLFQFKIGAYSPESMPLERLAQYMAELAALLGERTAVHFHRLVKGSTVVSTKVDREAVPKVRDRMASVRSADAATDAMRAYNSLNRLLRDDNATGVLREKRAHG